MEQNTMNGRLRVLMVEHHSPGNRYVLELSRALREECDLTIYCTKQTPYREEGVTWLPRFYGGGKGNVGAILDYGRTLADLSGTIRRGRYDVLHIQSFKKAETEMKLYLSLRRRYRLLVMTVHNVLPHEPTERDAALYGSFYRQCDLLIVHNEASGEELRSRFGIDERKIAVIPRGLYETYAPASAVGTGDGRTHFLCFGRVRMYKGIDILLEAVSLMTPEERAGCRVTVCGEQYPKLDPTDYPAMIRRLGVGDCVSFSGERVPEEEIPSLMGSADFTVFPYRKIYGSGVLLMSYTYNVPVICSDVPPFVEATDNGAAGLLFRSEDPASLRDALCEAMHWDEARKDGCRQEIRRIVDERHSWKLAARRTAESYLRRMGEKDGN